MNPTPEATPPERTQPWSESPSFRPVTGPDYWGVDLDPSRRPGVPMMRQHPQPWPNTRFPPEHQPGEPASPRHGRPNRPMPPVFGTATPLHGLSGVIRGLASRFPDHSPRYWVLKLLGDRVDAWGHRARRYLPLALSLGALGLLGRGALRSGSGWR